MLSNTAVPKEYGRFRHQVMNGNIRVCHEVSMQMNRIDHLIASPKYYYDSEAIDGFIDFCENELTLTNGDPVVLLDSFKLWAEDLLAWFYYKKEKVYDYKSHRFVKRKVLKRLVNKQYLIVARGNAKSMYASFLHAFFLYIDTSTTEQVATAPTAKQADETLAPIRTALAKHPGPFLSWMTLGNKMSRNEATKAKTASTKKGIENFLTNSLLQVIPMSIDKLQSFRFKMVSVDEWLSGHTREDVVGAAEQSAAKGGVDDYVILAISSEGTVRDGVGDTMKMELSKILRGEYEDPHTSIWWYKLDSIEEIKDPDMWIKAAPNIGVTVSYETYERDVTRAEHNPSVRNDILAKRFGIPVEGYTYFFTYEETLRHKLQNYDHMECSMGADMSQGDDFCAFTFLFPLGRNRYGVKTRAYVSEKKVNKLPLAMRNKYQEFIDEGSLIVMDGGILNMMDVYEDLNEFIAEHDYIVNSFGYDPYNALTFVDRWCKENGEYGVTKVRQGAYTESVPLGEIKNMAEDRDLIFDEHLMSFAMSNSVALQDNNGNYKLSKKRSDEKIDNVAALMDAWVAYKRYQDYYV